MRRRSRRAWPPPAVPEYCCLVESSRRVLQQRFVGLRALPSVSQTARMPLRFEALTWRYAPGRKPCLSSESSCSLTEEAQPHRPLRIVHVRIREAQLRQPEIDQHGLRGTLDRQRLKDSDLFRAQRHESPSRGYRRPSQNAKARPTICLRLTECEVPRRFSSPPSANRSGGGSPSCRWLRLQFVTGRRWRCDALSRNMVIDVQEPVGAGLAVVHCSVGG